MKSANRSWEKLIAEHYTSLTKFFRRRIPQPAEAEDLVQEAYLRLIRIDRRGDHETIHNPEAYLFTVATNLVREHAVLKRRAALNVDVDDVGPEWLMVEDSAAAAVDSNWHLRKIASVLAGLTPGQRAAMILHYREGLTYPQVAERLGTSVHMVKKHIAKALVLCRLSLLDSQGGGSHG